MIEFVEDYLDELFDSDFPKVAARLFNKIDYGNTGVLPSSNFVELVETLGESFHSEYLAGYLQKLDPNESFGLDRFDFVM